MKKLAWMFLWEMLLLCYLIDIFNWATNGTTPVHDGFAIVMTWRGMVWVFYILPFIVAFKFWWATRNKGMKKESTP